MAVVLLNSISDRRKVIYINLEYDREELTIGIMISALRNKSLVVKTESSNSQNRDILLAKCKVFGKSNYQSKSFNENKKQWSDKNKFQNNVKGKKCHYCGKLCHFAKDYYKKKNEYNEKRFDNGSATLIYNKAKTKNGLILVNMKKTNEYLTRCSFHMCPHKNNFLGF